MRTPKIRTIVYDERFEQELKYLIHHARRAEEFTRGAETILSRDPEAGCQLDDSKVWVICGHRVDAALYYTFDEDHVYFLVYRENEAAGAMMRMAAPRYAIRLIFRLNMVYALT